MPQSDHVVSAAPGDADRIGLAHARVLASVRDSDSQFAARVRDARIRLATADRLRWITARTVEAVVYDADAEVGLQRLDSFIEWCAAPGVRVVYVQRRAAETPADFRSRLAERFAPSDGAAASSAVGDQGRPPSVSR